MSIWPIRTRIKPRLWDQIRTSWRHRHARRIAVSRLSSLQPHWVALRFDETFVARLPEELVLAVDAEGVAREWTMQFTYRDERQRERDVRQVAPVAEAYFTLLAQAEAELVVGSSR